MHLLLPERGTPEGRVVLEQGQLAGLAYRLEPRICGSPVCECKQIALRCFPESPQAVAAETPLILELDLGRRIMVSPTPSEANPASSLAKAFMDEMTSDHWRYLWNYFFALKILYTERANLDELDTDFPSNASEGGMVGYYEILPFARPFKVVSADGHEWAFDDQYCVRPDCSCRAAVLQSFRFASQATDDAPQSSKFSFRYDYNTRRVTDVEKSKDSLSPEQFLELMRQTHPDFDAFLANRHEQLRHLYGRFLERHGVSDPRLSTADADAPSVLQDLSPKPVRAVQKPGRNDPCPCGSGKKYKKCCGRA